MRSVQDGRLHGQPELHGWNEGRHGGEPLFLLGVAGALLQKLEGAHDAPHVVGVDDGGACGIARLQRLPQGLVAVFLRVGGPAFADGVFHLSPLGKAKSSMAACTYWAGAAAEHRSLAAGVYIAKAAPANAWNRAAE